MVKDIKVASSKWIKSKRIFPTFEAWQSGYGAFTYSIEDKDNLIKYIKSHKEHNRKLSFKEELMILLKEHNIYFKEKYLD